MEKLMGILIVALLIVLLVALSFGGTCLIIWGICTLLSLQFSFRVAAAVWLIMCLMRSVFVNTVKK